MKLIHKLIFGFVLVALLSGITGYYSADVSREILQKTFIKTVEFLAAEIFNEIDSDLNSKVNIFREYSYDTLLQQELLRSNEEFRKMENVQEYIDNKDREWRSAPKEKITGFMLGLINNDISKTIRKKTGFYEDRNGYKVFPEVFVTNIYGANIAQTGKTTDYRQDDEEWWQTARRDGLYLGDAYDESADVYSVDIGLRIEDKNGNPIGIMKILVDMKSIVNLLEKTETFGLHSEHKTMEYQIITKDGKLIYSTGALDFLKDVSYLLPEPGNSLSGHGHSGIATLVRYDKGIFITYAYLTEPGDIKQDWILVVRQGADELFTPVTRLKYQILTASLTVILVGIFIGFLISNYISRAFKKLIDATVRIGKGDLETKIEVDSNDEIGQMGKAFKQMMEDLKITTVKRDEMALEIVERKLVEHKIVQINLLKEHLLCRDSLDIKLKHITDMIVSAFNADFARIWVIKPGDLCDTGCFHVEVSEGPHICRDRDNCLHLIASSGRYEHIDGGHRRVPFGSYKIGRIAAGESPKFITNDVVNDSHIHDNDWARELGLTSFGGYQLLSTDMKSIGVLAFFSKNILSNEDDALIEGIANTTAQVIQTTLAEESLKEAHREIEAWSLELEKKFRDKTDELQTTYVQLFHAEKLSSLGQMAAGIAHELNSPLTGLISMIKNYRDNASKGSEEYKHLSLMFEACEHMSQIINDFNAFSRKPESEHIEFDLIETIESSLILIMNQLKLKNIHVTKEYADERHIVKGNKTELQQVVLNIIRNAIDSMSYSGRLLIKEDIAPDNRAVEIKFTDNGCGISKENFEKIFDPFVTMTPQGKGIGLGLSISYAIIKNHKGEIKVESEIGKGTTFTILLPIVASELRERQNE